MVTLTEKEAENFLEKEGFNVVKRSLIKSKKELNNIKLNFPWVMKISSRHIVHKAKFGGTRLNIKSFKEAEKAFDELCQIENCEGVLIQEMLNGKELILGLKKTPEFGLVIMFGKGCSNVEKERDIAFRIVPIDKEETKKLIKEIKFYKLLKNNIDEDSLLEIITRLSNLAERYPQIEELDINPFIINSKEAIIVDARIVFK